MKLTPTQEATPYYVATEDDTRAAVKEALDYAGVTLDELIKQGSVGRFSSEPVRDAWIVYRAVKDLYDFSDLA